ncbi:FHIPEP family type III secretion protein [bacterium]|nr:FHIPEP family type III secretion protein [bacterium]
MTHYWLYAQYLLVSLLVLERLFGRGRGAGLQAVGQAALLLTRPVLVALVVAQTAGLAAETEVGLGLCTMLACSLLLLRQSPHRLLLDWLRLEGLLWTGLLLLCPAQVPLACCLLSSGLPLLLVLAGPLACSRYALVRCASGLAGLVLMVGMSHQLWLEPQPALAGPLAVFWFLGLWRSRSVVRPAPFSPLALAVLLEDLSPRAQASLSGYLRNGSWIPWSPYHPHLISPWEKAQLKAAAEELLESEFRHDVDFQPEVLAKSLMEWADSSSLPTLLTGLTPVREVAVFLMSLPPEVSAGLFKLVGPEAVQRLTLEISKLEPISPSLRGIVRQQFLGTPQTHTLESAARQYPAGLAALLCRRYRLPQIPPRPWPVQLKVVPTAVVLLLLASVSLWAEVGRKAMLPSAQDEIQALLDDTLGSQLARTAVVERGDRLYCTVLLNRLPDQMGQVEHLVKALLAPRPVEVTVVNCDLPARPTSWLPCAVLGVLCLGLAYVRRRRLTRVVSTVATPPTTLVSCGAKSTSYKSSPSLLYLDTVTVEVGRGLLGLVDPHQNAPLLEKVTSIRRHLADTRGFGLPGVRFRDNLKLPPDTYLFRVHGVEVARGQLQVNQLLARGCQEQFDTLRGTRVVDWDGQPAVWIRPEQREDAERAGCKLRSPGDSAHLHLSRVIERALPQILGIQEVRAWLDEVVRTHPALVAAVVPARHDLVSLRSVLRELLSRGVSLQSAVPILETLADHSSQSASPEKLASLVQANLPVRAGF